MDDKYDSFFIQQNVLVCTRMDFLPYVSAEIDITADLVLVESSKSKLLLVFLPKWFHHFREIRWQLREKRSRKCQLRILRQKRPTQERLSRDCWRMGLSNIWLSKFSSFWMDRRWKRVTSFVNDGGTLSDVINIFREFAKKLENFHNTWNIRL